MRETYSKQKGDAVTSPVPSAQSQTAYHQKQLIRPEVEAEGLSEENESSAASFPLIPSTPPALQMFLTIAKVPELSAPFVNADNHSVRFLEKQKQSSG